MATQPNFQLLGIFLIESHFKRENVLDDRYTKVQNHFEISTQASPISDSGEFAVFVKTRFSQKYEESVLVEIDTTTAGSFKRVVAVDDKVLNDFFKINAPAIIFPFIREHIASLSTKAGLLPILIQPVNFVDLAKEVAPAPDRNLHNE